MPGPPAAVRTFNRFAVRAAGHRLFPLWAVLRHRGRRTGAEHAVTVAVLTTPDAFVIALPWGRGTDWVRNTRAAGGCTVRWKGRDWVCTDPTFVRKDVALGAAGPVLRRVVARQDPEGGFLRLTRRPA